MGLRASKRGLSGLYRLDPFASCKAIRTSESEIPAPRAYRLNGYFDCVQDLKTRFTRLLGFSWPVTNPTVSPRTQKIPYFRDFIVRPERLTKGAGRSKRPRKAHRFTTISIQARSDFPGTPAKARKTRFTRGAWTMTTSKKTKIDIYTTIRRAKRGLPSKT